MARAPFQVLVIPYRVQTNGELAYAIFRRDDDGETWQALSGGGEDDETPLDAARREAWEEAGIPPASAYVALDAMASIPAIHFAAFRDRADLFVVPEYSFGVELVDIDLRLSPEHAEYAWLPYPEAYATLRWDSNKVALWELDRRVRARRK
jgi:dihydroneopterin triphosphate diphosphatase